MVQTNMFSDASSAFREKRLCVWFIFSAHRWLACHVIYFCELVSDVDEIEELFYGPAVIHTHAETCDLNVSTNTQIYYQFVNKNTIATSSDCGDLCWFSNESIKEVRH